MTSEPLAQIQNNFTELPSNKIALVNKMAMSAKNRKTWPLAQIQNSLIHTNIFLYDFYQIAQTVYIERTLHVIECSCFYKFRKSNKIRGLGSILSFFCNKFNKFINTRARMLDSIHFMTLRLLWNLNGGAKKLKILSLFTQHCYEHQSIALPKSVNHQWFIDFNAWRYFTPRRDVIW